MECLIHEVDTISNHGSDSLSKTLRGPCDYMRLQRGRVYTAPQN